MKNNREIKIKKNENISLKNIKGQEILDTIYDKKFIINDGDRIAQMVVAKLAAHELVEVEEFSETANKSRKGGLGSTGK